MKRMIQGSFAICLALFLFSCATLFKGSKTSNLNMSSSPESAKVFINGNYRGNTPLNLNLEADKSYDIKFEKPGFETIHYQVGNKVGTIWIILDILGGGWPIIVDAVTGAWYELDENNISVSLHKKQ